MALLKNFFIGLSNNSFLNNAAKKVGPRLETFNIKLLIIQKVKQHNIKVYNFIIINNTSYKIKF